ncbi:hypothetical protein TCDM_06090 [Trypanosoma cruzi Dm28c]|uniref:F-box domain-containing protein n=1 Tax=Trypanosoma cruzi Dm28c TaxID=1416333 RepID=V5BCQ3_TRYCR|nr:hypothetical protein TCDM_06090 [Trypanosoma cruzi Dm28c]
MQLSRRLPERRGGSNIHLLESQEIVGSMLTDLQNPLSPRTVAVELSNEIKTLPSSVEMKEINCGLFVHDVVGMRPKGNALSRRTTPPHSYCSLAHQLPTELVSVIMSFLDTRSLFQYRAVCRSLNNAFLSHGIQSLAPSLTSAVMDPTVGTDTLTGVMRIREAILERRERVWSHWLASYMATRLSQNVDEKTLQKMQLEGKALGAQLRHDGGPVAVPEKSGWGTKLITTAREIISAVTGLTSPLWVLLRAQELLRSFCPMEHYALTIQPIPFFCLFGGIVACFHVSRGVPKGRYPHGQLRRFETCGVFLIR